METENDPINSFIVPEGVMSERADKVLALHFKDISRVQIQRTFEKGNVVCKGKVLEKNTKINEGDAIEILFLKPKATEIKPVDIPLEILYEDKDLLVINKSVGMIVHPGSGTSEDTLVHALLHHTGGKLSLAGGEKRPGVVHRLDKETTGVILFAKTDKAYLKLIKMFEDRKINKEYLALVSGVPHLQSGSIKAPIGRDPRARVKMAIIPNGRPARTDWVLEEKLLSSALLRCYLLTGRTHQIRVHLASINHPILGDTTYGYRLKKEHEVAAPRVMLHAERIAFEHPISGEQMLFCAPLPEDFKEYLKMLRGFIEKR